MWKNKYEALAKLYSQLRQEHLDLLGKYKQLQVKAQSSNEAQEKLDRMEADMRAKNLELADMIRERDRAKNDLTRMRGVSSEFFFFKGKSHMTASSYLIFLFLNLEPTRRIGPSSKRA
jgi:hypothetical protein